MKGPSGNPPISEKIWKSVLQRKESKWNYHTCMGGHCDSRRHEVLSENCSTKHTMPLYDWLIKEAQVSTFLSIRFVRHFSQFTFIAFSEKLFILSHWTPYYLIVLSVSFAALLLHHRIFCLKSHPCLLVKSITCEDLARYNLLSGALP